MKEMGFGEPSLFCTLLRYSDDFEATRKLFVNYCDISETAKEMEKCEKYYLDNVEYC